MSEIRSIAQLTKNVIDARLLNFEFVEGTFSFDELKSLLGKRNFADFLMNHLQENGVTIDTSVKEGMQVFSPLKTSDGQILKFWVDQEGNLADVTVFRPNTLY